MTTSSTYAALVRQLDAGAYAVVPDALAHARAALRAADEAMRQVDAFAPLRPTAYTADGAVHGRLSAGGPVAYAEGLASQLAQGGSLPTDLVERAYAAVVHDAKAAAADTVARLLAVEVVRTFDYVADECVPALRAGLVTQLEALTARVLAAGKVLAGYDVTQPGALVAAPDKVRAAYATLGELAQEYAGLRAAQRALERSDDLPALGLYERLGLTEVRDALELWPDWREAERDRQAALPWPTDARQRLLLVASCAPWVPALEQLVALRTAAHVGPVAA